MLPDETPEDTPDETVSPGERVLVRDNGSFGQRWTELCRAFGLDVVER